MKNENHHGEEEGYRPSRGHGRYHRVDRSLNDGTWAEGCPSLVEVQKTPDLGSYLGSLEAVTCAEKELSYRVERL